MTTNPDNETEPTEPARGLVESARSRLFEARANPAPAGVVLYAVIRASSKYAYQGRRENGGVVVMRVTHLADNDYAFHLDNGNRYRREDLTFYTKLGNRFIKLR